MLDVISSAEQLVSVALQLVLIVLLLFGPTRQYLLILLYSVAYLITTVSEVYVVHLIGRRSELYRILYWTDEIVLDLLLLAILMLLAFRATAGDNILRGAVRKLLVGGVTAAILLPFVLSSDPLFSSRWFRFASQVLNFGGALLNIGLWTALIASKKRDPQLLTVSAGWGLAATGQAIYYGALLLVSGTHSRWIGVVTEQLNVLTHILGVAIWCWAFRPSARNKGSASGATPPHSNPIEPATGTGPASANSQVLPSAS